MEDIHKKRPTASPNVHLPPPANIYPYAGVAAAPNHLHRAASHLFHQASNYNGHGDGTMQSMIGGFNGMSYPNAGFAAAKRSSSNVSARSTNFGGVTVNGGVPQGYVVNGQILWPSAAMMQGGGVHGQQGLVGSPAVYQNAGQHFGYQGWPTQMLDHSPNGTSSWNSSRNTSAEVPALITPRRGSSSTTEDGIPGTPFTTYTGYGGVQILDQHSPNSVFFGTPSPQSLAGKGAVVHSVPPEILSLIMRDPPIPHAVPAPNSPVKTLDRALQNANGITNVYIRGLQPDTTDAMLQEWALRFGDIVSSKSIIDHSTDKCKGYGFVKYHNFKDAENCIRGFHYMGYESSFARESFYSVLKKLSDDKNTNLYVSNLPKDMNEHELAALFDPYEVCSSRILRNADGSGRGVGFARFESRDHCEKIIREFNNTPVHKDGGEEHLMQIRYADTKDQKALKQQTTAARNFRTAEYESVTSGQMSMVPVMGRAVLPSPQINSDFESYMAAANGVHGSDGRGGHMRQEHQDRAARLSFSHLSSESDRTVVNLPQAKTTSGNSFAAPGKENIKAAAINASPKQHSPVEEVEIE